MCSLDSKPEHAGKLTFLVLASCDPAQKVFCQCVILQRILKILSLRYLFSFLIVIEVVLEEAVGDSEIDLAPRFLALFRPICRSEGLVQSVALKRCAFFL